jgi:hypothetical protein
VRYEERKKKPEMLRFEDVVAKKEKGSPDGA